MQFQALDELLVLRSFAKIYGITHHPFSWPESQYEAKLHDGKAIIFPLIYSNISKIDGNCSIRCTYAGSLLHAQNTYP